jgi:hypothetical protein
MTIANPEMYRICYNPSIGGEQKAERAPAREWIDRQGFEALANSALRRISENENAVYDDWKLKPV